MLIYLLFQERDSETRKLCSIKCTKNEFSTLVEIFYFYTHSIHN